jgi:hypothetical protein
MNMIAIGTGHAALLLGFVGLILAVGWGMLRWTFELIEDAHERMRATALSHQRQKARVRGDD